MAQGPYPVSASEASWRIFRFILVKATDGCTPETGEAGGQPQISKNGGSWTNTSDTLHHVGNGHYYITLTTSEIDTIGDIAIRYKSTNTCEFQDTARVIWWNMMSGTNTGIYNIDTYLDAPVSECAKPGDQMDLIGLVNNTAVYRIQAGLAAPGDKMDLVDDVIDDLITGIWNYSTRTITSISSFLSEIVSAIWGATVRTVTGIGGSGTSTLTITVQDDTDAPVGLCPVLISNLAGQKLAYDITQTDDGTYTVRLDDGSYSVILGPAHGYSFSNPYTVAVSGDTSTTLSCQRLTGQIVPGGLTLAKLRSAVDLYIRRTYADNARFVTPELRDMWINSAYQQIDTWMRWTRTTLTFQTVASQSEYTWQPGVHEVLSATIELADGTLASLKQLDIDEYTSKCVTSTSASTPQFFIIHGDALYLYPKPETGGLNVTLYVVASPGILDDDTSTPQWPVDLHHYIVDLAMAQAAMYFGDPATATNMRMAIHAQVMAALARPSSETHESMRVRMKGV